MHNLSVEVQNALELLSVPVIHKQDARDILWNITKKQRIELAQFLRIETNGKEKTGDLISSIIDEKFKTFCFGFNY